MITKLMRSVGAASLLLWGTVALADQPKPNCPAQAAQATVTCLGSVRGLMSPNPVDKVLGAIAAPECLRQTYNAASCYGAQQQPTTPAGPRR